MIKFRVKANPSGQYYFPKEVRQELGKELNLICGIKVAVVYNSNTPLEVVLKSLEIIEENLKLRLKVESE